MTDETDGSIPAAPFRSSVVPVEQVNSVHIVDAVSASISTDGKSAMMVFLVAQENAPPRKFAMTISAGHIDGLRQMVHRLAMQGLAMGNQYNKQVTRSIGPTGSEEVFVADFTEPDANGTKDQAGRRQLQPGLILTLNPSRPEEMCFHIEHLTAVKLAELLNRKSTPRLTVEERKVLKDWRNALEMHEAAAKAPQQQVITPDGTVFDVPGSTIH